MLKRMDRYRTELGQIQNRILIQKSGYTLVAKIRKCKINSRAMAKRKSPAPDMVTIRPRGIGEILEWTFCALIDKGDCKPRWHEDSCYFHKSSYRLYRCSRKAKTIKTMAIVEIVWRNPKTRPKLLWWNVTEGICSLETLATTDRERSRGPVKRLTWQWQPKGCCEVVVEAAEKRKETR